jgi:hypothetical protein
MDRSYLFFLKEIFLDVGNLPKNMNKRIRTEECEQKNKNLRI